MSTLRKILYFERDKDVRAELLFSLTEKGGFDVSHFDNGDDAIAVASDLKPDIILLNADLVDMTAPEFLHKLRKYDHLARVPAVLITSQKVDGNYIDNNDAGVVGVLSKHTRGQDLIISLHEIWSSLADKNRNGLS